MAAPEYWKVGEKVSLRNAFGRILTHLASSRSDFVVFDADVAGGTGAKPFVDAFPERTFQFGISEQNMMAAAGGFSDSGIIPVVTTFAAFGVMRAHEQFRTAIAYPNRNVKLCCSHIGMDVGPDGATAQMLEDFATVRAIPNVAIVVPADPNELMDAFPKILDWRGPVYMRIGTSPNPVIFKGGEGFEIGKARRVRAGSYVSILATGVMVARGLEAAEALEREGVSARVVNISSIKPLPEDEILSAARETGAIVTAEDHNIYGGMGSAVAQFLAEKHPVPMKLVGVQDRFGKSGEADELAELYGLTAKDIAAACRSLASKGGRNVRA